MLSAPCIHLMNLLSITALCFPTHSYKCPSNCHHSARAAHVFPYHPLHPHTLVVNGGVRVWDRKECGGVRGERLRKVMVRAIGQRGTVYPLSPCWGDSGVSVLGLAGSPPSPSHSLSRSLSQELLLIRPVCFGWHTVALSSNTLAPASACADTRVSQTHTRLRTFVCFGRHQVPLSRASKRQRSAEHNTMFTFAEHGHTPPAIV